uniref:Uncharacterized protein n=1 Tax=Setaria italica TaxID=4555 RepID=K3YB34_SETIT
MALVSWAIAMQYQVQEVWWILLCHFIMHSKAFGACPTASSQVLPNILEQVGVLSHRKTYMDNINFLVSISLENILQRVQHESDLPHSIRTTKQCTGKEMAQ